MRQPRVTRGLRFEMRYFGEGCWYVTTAEHLARTLVPYDPNLIGMPGPHVQW